MYHTNMPVMYSVLTFVHFKLFYIVLGKKSRAKISLVFQCVTECFFSVCGSCIVRICLFQTLLIHMSLCCRKTHVWTRYIVGVLITKG